MMYSEFLSMTGKEESYISYKEYTESIIFFMKNEGYTVREIAEQAQKDFAMEFDGCSCKDVMKVISRLSNKKSGMLHTLVAEILEQYE